MTAEATEQPADDAHISFAKRLAHNNKETRLSALRKLKRWLVTKSKQGTLDHTEIIKIWKGLHYSMWYSDKPLIQEALALDISQIVTLIPDVEDSVRFFGGFCQTIAREWDLIDKLRLDKFYMLLKTALKCVMEFCAEKSWDVDIVLNIAQELDTSFINSETCPSSIPVYISEHFLALYSEVSTDTTPSLFVTKILMSYVTTLSRTPKKDLNRVIMTNLFNPITSKTVNIILDLQMLNDHIQQLAIKPDILTRNRKLLYRLRNDVTMAIEGDLSKLSPLGKHKLVDSTIQSLGAIAVNSVPNGCVEVESLPEPKKKKKNVVDSLGVIAEDSVPNGCVEDGSLPEPKKKKKKLVDSTIQSLGVIAVNSVPNGCVEDESLPEPKKKKKKKPKAAVSTTGSEATITEDVIGSLAEPQMINEFQTTVATAESCVALESVNGYTEPTVVDSVDCNKPGTKVKSKKKKKAKLTAKAIEIDAVEAVCAVDDSPVETTVISSVESVEQTMETQNDVNLVESSKGNETPEFDNSPLAPNNVELNEGVPINDSTEADVEDESPPSEITENVTESLESDDIPTGDTPTPTPVSDPVSDTQDRQPVAESETNTVTELSTPKVSKSPVRRKSERKKRRKSIEKTPSMMSTPPSNITASTPGDDGSSSVTKKKVRMSMENNQTFFFKKNASLESPVPFDFSRTPVKGVLKASPATTRSRSKQGRGRSRVRK